MPRRAKRTLSLPAKEASYIEALVSSGAYASPRAVIRAGLNALRDRDATFEQWLRDKVVPVYDTMRSDPGRAVSTAEVAGAIKARHADRVKKAKRGI
jgi:antitoxin ParD1/3/4